MKPAVVFLCLILAALLVPASALAQEGSKIPFEDSDTIQEIQAKIKANGYNFTVKENWVYNMAPAQKSRFLSRSAPVVPRMAEEVDYGPLMDQIGTRALPASFDWRNFNGRSYIGPVRDQGACGACYSFGACAAAEGVYNYANGLYDGNCADFSEAYIAFCLSTIPPYSSQFSGCSGSDYDYGELDALVNNGTTWEANFPYVTSDPGACTHWGDPVVTMDAWHRIPCGDIDAIKTAIMTYGVVDVAVMTSSAFQAYDSGIYEDANTSCYSTPCYYTPTDHIVSLVGWNDNGDAANNGYWILRNSWGSGWGESGYMRIKYNSAVVACEAAYLVYTGSGSQNTAYYSHITTGDPYWDDFFSADNNTGTTLSYTMNFLPQGSADSITRQVGPWEYAQILVKPESGSATSAIVSYDQGLTVRAGYESTLGGGIAEFMLTGETSQTLGYYFTNFATSTTWKGLTIQNPGTTSADLTLYCYDNGVLRGTATDTIAAGQRKVGHVTTWFPGVSLTQPQRIVVVSTQGITGIAVSGNNDGSKITYTPAVPVQDFAP